jgi:acyl-CoA thioesterase FadM
MPTVLAFRYPIAGRHARRQSPVGLFDESSMVMRVLPNDCDFNLHINNGRYLSLMDLGRINHATRSGWWRVFQDNDWQPVAAGVTIRYRRELRIGARYRLFTTCLGWTDRWTFFEQRFERMDGLLAARAYVKVAALDDQRRAMSPSVVVTAMGLEPVSKELPADILRWQKIEAG